MSLRIAPLSPYAYDDPDTGPSSPISLLNSAIKLSVNANLRYHPTRTSAITLRASPLSPYAPPTQSPVLTARMRLLPEVGSLQPTTPVGYCPTVFPYAIWSFAIDFARYRSGLGAAAEVEYASVPNRTVCTVGSPGTI
eukprot:964375-Rhodomonas_salina.2